MLYRYRYILSSKLRHPSSQIMTRNISLLGLFKETPIPVPEKLEINLTPDEDQLYTLLDECKQELQRKGEDVECRIAGGWVRDKLLGAQSNDIDVALSNMMGVTFAEHFVSFVGSKNLPVKTVSTIARNPEQSKHLETARTTVLGVDLDFVNLRSESYAEGSRIPTEVKLGTPLEDALRRDITINALFYNVHTRKVEDCTERGLEDLRNGVLRTPLAPFETFKDDPLRVIRCIRFASRFGFRMVKEIEQAMQNREIQDAIVTKISRERVGEEFDKMMKGRDPLHSIRLMKNLNVQPSLFALPSSISSTFNQEPGPTSLSLGASIILQALLTSPSSLSLPEPHPLLLSQLSLDKSLRPRLYLSAALTPYKHVTYTTPKKKTFSAVEVVIKEALKLGLQNHYSDGVPALFAAAEELQGISSKTYDGARERSKIGLLLRAKTVHNSNTGSHWTSSLLFSLAQELVPFWDAEADIFDAEVAATIVTRYNEFVNRVEELELPACIDDKPILNGKEVVTILGASKPGPWTGEVLAKISEWALDNPKGTKDECKAWLKGEQAAGNINITLNGQGGPPPKRTKV